MLLCLHKANLMNLLQIAKYLQFLLSLNTVGREKPKRCSHIDAEIGVSKGRQHLWAFC